MEKKKKKAKIKVFGMKLKNILQLGTIIGSCVWAVHWLDQKFEKIDDRFEKIDIRFERIEARLDGIEVRLDKIETDLKKTSDLLDAYLTWRFISVNDPVRKNLVPVYDPRTRTLEFLDKRNMGK
ncbi:MAG: hypothetical protein WDO14_19765 [Bacteroidota bacterium]